MLQNLKLGAILALLTSSVMAQSIRGTVRDAVSRELLVGATVQIVNTERYAVSDDQGVFSLDGITNGEYSLQVKYLGYITATVPITVKDKVFVEIELSENVIFTDEVLIRSTRADNLSPTTYLTIEKKELEKQNFGQDLPFVLNYTPSLVTTSDAGAGIGYTGVRIRGSDATRINVTINGIPYNDSESQGTFWVNLPDIASSTESIQIQRGVGTSTNGGSAFGGSINLQTSTKRDEGYVDFVNSFGSFGTRRHTLGFGTGLLNKHFVFDGRLSKIESDGFIDRATSDLKSYYLSAGYYKDKTILRFLAFGGKERTYQSWYGVPESRLNNDVDAMMTTAMNEGWNEEQTTNLLNSSSRTFNAYLYPNQVDDYGQDHYQLHLSHAVSEAVNANVSLHYTKGRGFYEEFRYNDNFADYGLPSVTIGDSAISSVDLIRRRWLDNDFYGMTYSLSYDRAKLSSVLGGALNKYVGDHFGEILWSQVSTVPIEYPYYFNVGEKTDFTIFLKTNYQILPSVSTYVDVQYRNVGYEAQGKENNQRNFFVNENFNFFNPKLGATIFLNKSDQVYTSFAVANREPVRNDFVDNIDNKPVHETLYNLELGYKIQREAFSFSANYYRMDYQNQLVLTGALNDVGASIRTNVERSFRTGIEVEGTWRIASKVRWDANFTLSRNKIVRFTEVLYDYGVNFDEFIEVRNTYRNSDISFSPSLIGASTLSWTPIPQAELSFLTKYVGEQFLDNTSNEARKIDPYLVNDLRLSYSFKPTFAKEVSCSLLVNNIFNHLYESNGFTYGYNGGGQVFRENFYYPQAGTNFLCMVSMRF